MSDFYDVVISGAGPVGLFLACELALAKCSVLVLEKMATAESVLKRLPFGVRGLSAPSVEAFDRRGLLSQLELHQRMANPHANTATHGPRRQVGHFAGIPFFEGDVETSRWKRRLPSATPPSLISEMNEIETVLTRRAVNLGVEIRRGVGVTSFHQREDGVLVQSRETSVSARWLVGCDGSRSVVRKLSGVEFAGTEPEFTGYTLLVDLDDPAKLAPGRHVTERGMYMQSQIGYLMLQDFDRGEFHALQKPVTLEHAEKVIRRISDTDVRVTKLHAAASWTDRARQATAYRKGRILLAGDAAHIHSPLGGQGLNLGLGDAMNLGWKLAATVQNRAPDGLLDTYHTERHPVGAKVLEWSRAQVLIMKPDPASRALHAIMKDLVQTRDGATYFAGRVWGVETRYDLGGPHPLVGESVPNFTFDDGTTIHEQMREGQGLLLDFARDAHGTEKLKAFSGDLLKCVAKKAKEDLGLRAALIRPDGIIAWATDREIDEPSFKEAMARWFR